MKSLSHHIHTVRSKPHHVRKQVAFALALAITAVIALLWLILSLSFGAFRTQDTSFADATSQAQGSPAAAPEGNSLLGAAITAFSGSTTPASLQVVNPNTPAPTQAPAADTQTVIPF